MVFNNAKDMPPGRLMNAVEVDGGVMNNLAGNRTMNCGCCLELNRATNLSKVFLNSEPCSV